MVSILFILKAGWLLHIHIFLDWLIQKGTLDIHLINLEIMVGGISK
jgi:hypothetical protein